MEFIHEVWPRRHRAISWHPRHATITAPTTRHHREATAVAIIHPPTMLSRMLECVSGLANSAPLLLSHFRCQRRHQYFVGVDTSEDFFPPNESGTEHFFTNFPSRAPPSPLGEGYSHVLQGLLDLSPRASFLSYKIFIPFLFRRGGLLLFGRRFRLQASLLGSRQLCRLGPALLQWNNKIVCQQANRECFVGGGGGVVRTPREGERMEKGEEAGFCALHVPHRSQVP